MRCIASRGHPPIEAKSVRPARPTAPPDPAQAFRQCMPDTFSAPEWALLQVRSFLGEFISFAANPFHSLRIHFLMLGFLAPSQDPAADEVACANPEQCSGKHDDEIVGV